MKFPIHRSRVSLKLVVKDAFLLSEGTNEQIKAGTHDLKVLRSIGSLSPDVLSIIFDRHLQLDPMEALQSGQALEKNHTKNT